MGVENSKAVTKLAQKKARAQFFEDMYNSSGLSVTSSLTPEKPKRLCDMNLPSPRVGPGSPQAEKVEGKVELLAKQIEEKEKLNKSLDSDVTSLERRIDNEVVVEEKQDGDKDHAEPEKNMEESSQDNQETIGESLEEEVRQDLIEVTKTEHLEEKVERVQNEVVGHIEDDRYKCIYLQGSNDPPGALDETLPSTARLEPLE